QGSGREDLQGHAAAERALLSFVDDAHAAVSDLAEDAIVAQLVRRRSGLEPGAIRRGRLAVDCRRGDAQRTLTEGFHQKQGREEVADRRGQLRVPRLVFLHRRSLAAAATLEKLLGQQLYRFPRATRAVR